MRRTIGGLLLCLAVAAQACKKKPDGSADAATSDGPAVRLQGSTVMLNGEPAGTTRVIEDLGRMQKIDDLFERLKKDREAFKAANPATPFPGRASISAEPETPAIVFKSMFQTAAFAGYPSLKVSILGDAARGSSDAVTVGAIIPGPPGESSGPRRAVHIHVSDASIALVEKLGGDVAYDDRFDSGMNMTELRDRLNRTVVDLFLRRDLRANPVVDVVVHVENRLPYKQLSAALRGLGDAHERLAGPDENGAFTLRLAVN